MFWLSLAILLPTALLSQDRKLAPQESLLKVALTAVQARSQRRVYGFRASPPPLFRPGSDFYVDVADLNRQLRTLGLPQESVAADGVPIDDVRIKPRSWSSLESCTIVKQLNARRCTLPHGVQVVRLQQLAWADSGRVLTLWISVNHRAELGRGFTGIGGHATEYTFLFRQGKWEFLKAGPSMVS